MTSHNFQSVDSIDGVSKSRRALLQALTATPIAISTASVAAPWRQSLIRVHQAYGDEPTTLRRTADGRALSLARYHNAESFFVGIAERAPFSQSDLFYQAGIVAQLGLSAHLLDIGFDDAWCARHIGLCVAHAIAYANATGFGHDCPEMARLATVLTPYWKWNRPSLFGEPKPDSDGFTVEQVDPLLRALLNRVRRVTGHPRPSFAGNARKDGKS